jgi:hypothetical protein
MKRLFRGLRRSRIKLCSRVLAKIVELSTPPTAYTEFTTGDIAAATIVLDALQTALDRTTPA